MFEQADIYRRQASALLLRLHLVHIYFLRSLFCLLVLCGASRAYAYDVEEVEPNNSAQTAQVLNPSPYVVLKGSLLSAADIDIFSVQLNAGDLISAATMTAFSTSNTNTVLDVLDSSGTTIVASDDDDGTFSTTASSIAGYRAATAGTYYVRVSTLASNLVAPYELHIGFQSSAISSIPEVEPNGTIASANSRSVLSFSSGTISEVDDVDFYRFTLASGTMLFASLDTDPERDGILFNGKLILHLPGGATLEADSGAKSESLFFVATVAGTYQLSVRDGSGGGGSSTSTYHLQSFAKSIDGRAGCVTVSSPVLNASLPDQDSYSSSLTIPQSFKIDDVSLSLSMAHDSFGDVDIVLTSPDGIPIPILGDVAVGGISFSASLSDKYGAIPVNVARPVSSFLKPGSTTRLGWFKGVSSQGDWKLTIYDKEAENTGVLRSWGLTMCPAKEEPLCSDGFVKGVGYFSDFESGANGFVHSGTNDLWQLGMPTQAPVASCFSGSTCWKTNLAGTYSGSSNQDLLSPIIDLKDFVAPLTVSWAQKHQIENAGFDGALIEARNPGGGQELKLFEWQDPTMPRAVGAQNTALGVAAGWGIYTADVSRFAAKQMELRYNLHSDSSINFAGLAIDNVKISGCLVDTDRDGVADKFEACPTDPAKTAPGKCGCGVVDVDSDNDGILNCKEECPYDHEKTIAGVCGCGMRDEDADGDGLVDCIDQCPLDAGKGKFGICGCGVPDVDLNKNQIVDCKFSDELRFALGEAKKFLKNVAYAAGKLTAKQKKVRDGLNQSLSDAAKLVLTSGALIKTTDTKYSADKILKDIKQKAGRLFKSKQKAFKANKSRVATSIDGLRDVLAA